MADVPVKVTYSGPLLFLASGQWTHVFSCLKERLPLRNLHWKSTARPSIRSVQELNIDLVQIDSVRDEPSSQIPSTVLERPLLNLYFVTCEDADTYKASVRKQIKDWHSLVSQRKNQEWLIILVIRPDFQATSTRLFQRGTVIDKIRADFNATKRDRCVQLAWAMGSDDPAAWTDLISKLKEGIISSFDSNIIQREEEVKRSEVQRQMPGWNFCTFFILKESMATSFEGMNLVDDAQIQYDELEASFFQVLKEKNLSWFGQLGGTAPNDDSAPLLSIAKKPYRDLILSNTITVFDFRSYLLARQCYLLARQGKITEAAVKAERFVTGFARTLRENQHSLSEFFLESWMYSSAFNVVEQCEAWAGSAGTEGQAMQSFQAVKGELLELARSQLDKIGIRMGYLPAEAPFTIGLDTIPLPSPTSSEISDGTTQNRGPKISTPELIEALKSRDAFDRLYITTTNKAIQTYGSCGRRRFALKLHASLAALDQCRERFPSAHAVFASLPGHYVNSRWSSLEAFCLTKSLESNDAAMNDPPSFDTEWVTQALAFFKALVNHTGRGIWNTESNLEGETDFAGKSGIPKAEYVRSILANVQGAAPLMAKDHPVLSYPGFAFEVRGSDVRLGHTEDGTFISIHVTNHLTTAILVDRVECTLNGAADEPRLCFKTLHLSPFELPRGRSKLELFCPDPSPGLYFPDSASVHVGRIQFNYPNVSTLSRINQRTEKGSSSEMKKHSTRHQAIRIPLDSQSTDVEASFPKDVTLDGTPHLTLTLRSGRNRLTESSISMSNPGDEVKFALNDFAILDNSSGAACTVANDAIVVTDVPHDQELSLSIPYSGARLDTMKVRITVEYRTDAQPDVERRIVRTRNINTSLPLAVNVQDYFRGTKLFSRFAIRCADRHTLYLLDASLQSRLDNSTLRITRCRSSSGAPQTISPSRPLYHLFMLENDHHEPSTDAETLVLILTYRNSFEAVERRVVKALEDLSSVDPPTALWLRRIIPELFREDESLMDLPSKELSAFLSTALLGRANAAARDNLLDSTTLSQLLQSLENTSLHDDVNSPSSWRTLSIPLDLPSINILNAANLSIPDYTTTPMYAGQPVRAQISIKTSLHWGTMSSNMKYRLRFEVTSDATGSWLISGRRRGDYVAKHDSTFETDITLVPLRHGSVNLPKISVTPVIENTDSDFAAEPPSCETHQTHGIERVNVLPRSARSTYVVQL